MLLAQGLQLHRPKAVIPWIDTAANYGPVLGSVPELAPPTAWGFTPTSTEHTLRDVTLVPGVAGVLRVRLSPEGDRWAMIESVLYMGHAQSPADDGVRPALEAALGRAEMVPALDAGPQSHSELHRWRSGAVVVSHGWFEEHDAYDDWSEQEVRVQRADRPAPWR